MDTGDGEATIAGTGNKEQGTGGREQRLDTQAGAGTSFRSYSVLQSWVLYQLAFCGQKKPLAVVYQGE